jgi:hypothetical protein
LIAWTRWGRSCPYTPYKEWFVPNITIPQAGVAVCEEGAAEWVSHSRSGLGLTTVGCLTPCGLLSSDMRTSFRCVVSGRFEISEVRGARSRLFVFVFHCTVTLDALTGGTPLRMVIP